MSIKKPTKGPRKRIRTTRKKRPWTPMEADRMAEEDDPMLTDEEVGVGPGKDAAGEAMR